MLTTLRNDRMGSDYMWITRIVVSLTYIPPICLGPTDMALSSTLNLVCVRVCGMQSLIFWKHFSPLALKCTLHTSWGMCHKLILCTLTQGADCTSQKGYGHAPLKRTLIRNIVLHLIGNCTWCCVYSHSNCRHGECSDLVYSQRPRPEECVKSWPGHNTVVSWCLNAGHAQQQGGQNASNAYFMHTVPRLSL